MTLNTPFSRPWIRTFIPAGAILVFLTFVFVSQHRNDIALPRLDGTTTFSERPVVENTTPAKTKAVVTSVQKEDETTADWLAEFLPD
jgi:hypothetical protein